MGLLLWRFYLITLADDTSCEVEFSITDHSGNANILKCRNTAPTRDNFVVPWTSFGRTNTSTPASPPLKRGNIYTVLPSLRASLGSPESSTESRGLEGVQNNKKLPPMREEVIYFLRFLNSSDVRPTSEIIFFSTPGDISRPGCFGTGKMIPSFIKITCDHFCLSIT
jgi:hypothetical protein